MAPFDFVLVSTLCISVFATSEPDAKPEGCLHNGMLYKPGESFMIDCNTCRCGQGGLAGCTLMACPPVELESCTHNGMTYKHGEMFMDDCNSCRCINGLALCTRMGCSSFRDKKSCIHEGTTYKHGDTYKDKCNTCKCIYGKGACTRMACGILDKRTSEPRLPNKCYFLGKFRDVGESFTNGEDCNTCTCNGQGFDTYISCTEKFC